jgi:hypothetical protein
VSTAYFTAQEADLFTFYRIPKELFTNPKYKHVCTEAKVLYGLQLDRNSLSMKNGWIDERGYVYIYFTREEAMEVLGIANPKATSLFKELREVDLIEEVRQGLGKANIIYVKKFIQTPEGVAIPQNQENLESGTKKISSQEPRKSQLRNQENLEEIILNTNKTERNDTELKRNLTTQVSNKTHTGFKRGNITPLHTEQVQEKQEEQRTVCEPVASPREAVKQETHDFLEGKRTSYPRVEESIPTELKQVHNQPPPVAQPTSVSLEQLQQDIQAVIGEEINVMRLARLIQTASLERIRYHLEHWHIHKLNQTRPGAGYFLTVVENDIPPVAPEKKPSGTASKKPQRDNFDQRTYSDEELEKFYANLT